MRNWLEVHIYERARREIQEWPTEVKKDLGAILTKVQKGSQVGPPDTKLMATVAPGVFEIRLKEPSGIYRAFYLIETKHGILVFHAFKKKSQKTPVHEIRSGRARLNTFLEELNEK